MKSSSRQMVMLSLILVVGLGGLPTNAMPAAQRSARQNRNANTRELSEAASLLEAGRLKEAEAAARKLIAARPRDPDAYILLGVILDQLGLSAEAEAAYHSALKLQPNSVPALSNLGVLLDRKSTRLNSSHSQISYAVFCLKKKKKNKKEHTNTK